MPSLRAVLVAVALAIVLVVARTPHAQAQTAGGGTTFSDSSGLIWGVGVFEASIVLGAVVIGSGDACQSWGCGILMMMIAGLGLVAAVATGIATQVGGSPPDVPFVFHEAIWGGLGGLALGEAIAKGSHARPGAELGLALGGALLMGGAAAGYSIARRDTLFRDPDTTWATHLLAWGPMLVGLVAASIFDDFQSPAELAALAVTMLATQGLAVLAVELSAGDAPAGTVAPLFAYRTSF